VFLAIQLYFANRNLYKPSFILPFTVIIFITITVALCAKSPHRNIKKKNNEKDKELKNPEIAERFLKWREI